jgi:pilus assembly protein CpaB
MKRRLLTIVLALVLAAIGTGGVLAYAKGADARAITGMKAVSVLVAQKQIPSGTSAGAALKRGLLAAEKLPAASVPSNAVRSVIPALSPLVTSAVVQPGQLLLRAMLVKAVAPTPGSVTLPTGMIEVTVNLCVPEAVAGDLQAG